jgi:type I restriction enzyme S subunit
VSAELLLLREFERVGDAPDAIRNLRPFIVELALRGDLTATTPERLRGDAVDLTRIHRGMETLVSLRPRYRWTKPVTCAANHSETPPNWRPTELANTGLYINGLPFKPSDWGKIGRPIIRIQNLSGQNRDYHYTEGDFSRDNLVDSGDLLVSWSATLDTFVWDGPEGVVNQHIFKVIPNTEAVTSGFLYWLLKHEVRQLARSQHAHGLAMMHINRGPFLSHKVALPPLAEQHRIVAKVDELMALCDQLAAAQEERDLQRDALRSVSLHRLTEPLDEPAVVGFFLDKSPRLLTKPEHVAAVRQTILDLAVRGRLVAQDSTWADVTPPLVCSLIVDGDHNPPSRQSNGVPHLTAKNVVGGQIRIVGCSYISESDFLITKKRYDPRVGDVLLTCVGTLGRTAIVPEGIVFSADRNLAALRPDASKCSSSFLKLVLDSPRSQRTIASASGQTAQPHIYLKDIRTLSFKLPSIPEQHRIIAKVDELMAVCDELEAALTSAQDGRGRLLESLLHDALDGSAVRTMVGAGAD